MSAVVANPTIPQPWAKGTDLRNDKGLYVWPHLMFDAEVREYFPSVTTILDIANGGMKFAECWFIAEYVDHVTACAEMKTMVPYWDKDKGEMVDRSPRDILHDKHWIKSAGAREMTRRANRGTIGHDALEDWCLHGLYIEEPDMEEYVADLIQRNDFALPVDYCIDYVRQIVKWCNEHVVEVLASESPVFNRTYAYAGTRDLMCRLRGLKEEDGSWIPEEHVWNIDAKNSKGPQATHPMQSAAYDFAELIGVKGTDILIPNERATRSANLYVQPEKATLREWKKAQEAFDAFLHLRMVWQYLMAGDLPVTVKRPKVPTPTRDQMKIPGVS